MKSAKKEITPWDSNALWAKAQRYAETMLAEERSSWKFGFWSAFTLEILGRAVLASKSPVLLADPKDWNNIYHALGDIPKTPKYTPRSIPVAEVFNRINKIFPDFTDKMYNFCILHMEKRNSEVHSSSIVFESLEESEWLGEFYFTCEAFTKILNESLSSLLGDEEANTANKLIASFNDKNADSAKDLVEAHKKIWKHKEDEERERLSKQAGLYAMRQIGHRVKCPVCGSDALISGAPIAPPKREIQDDFIIERQSMLPERFECTACGLKLSGLSKLNACGLGNTYTSKSTYEPADFFGLDDHNYFDEDNNE